MGTRGLRHLANWIISILYRQTISVLLLVSCVAAAFMIWQASSSHSRLVESAAIHEASHHLNLLTEVRSVYTSEVVKPAIAQGLEVTHDYASKEGAIPLPASLSILLGERLAATQKGGRLRIYSDFPFPWRNDGGPHDAFETEALNWLRQNPDEPFYRFEETGGRKVLRYAAADVMRRDCVSCHNSHPDSPRHDWKVGDVRGVLEVTLPMDAAVAQADKELVGTVVLVGGAGLFGLLGIAVVIRRLRADSAELRDRIKQRAATEAQLETKSGELSKANEDLQQLAAALAEQSHLTQAILDTAAEGIITIDQRGIVESFNPAAEMIFGYPSAEVIGKNIKMLMPSPHSQRHDGYLANYLATGNSQVLGIEREIQGLRKDGTTFPIEVSISELLVGNRRIFTGIVRDMTRRKQLETQLAHAQKMESVGQLAAGMAHEINTPIQFVGDNTRFLHDAFGDLDQLLSLYEQLEQACEHGEPPPTLLRSIRETLETKDLQFVREEIPKALDQTLEGAERVARIVRAMREFSHPGSREKKEVDVNQAIESTSIVTRHEWKYVADLVTDLDPDLPLVPCLADDLNQAILNLIVNSAHAIGQIVGSSGQKGTITISTRGEDGWAEIRVADTGGGIPEKYRSRIFDPFFTTKPVGKGTGQGLAIVYAVVVEKHGGQIDFVSQEGQGTTFILRLPIKHSHTRSGGTSSEKTHSVR